MCCVIYSRLIFWSHCYLSYHVLAHVQQLLLLNYCYCYRFMAFIQDSLCWTAPPVKNWRICWSKVLLYACRCWRHVAHSDHGEDADLLLNSVTCTVSMPSMAAKLGILWNFSKYWLDINLRVHKFAYWWPAVCCVVEWVLFVDVVITWYVSYDVVMLWLYVFLH